MKVAYASLEDAAVTILESLGAAPDEARLTAAAMAQADARGIDTHGVYLLTVVSERVQAGMLNLPTKLTTLMDEGAVGLIDGGNGLGQAAVSRAMTLAIAKADRYGIGSCSVRNTNNIGMLSLYSEQAVASRKVGIVMANAAPAISPWGGAKAFLGTNPISIGIPGGRGPAVLLDMSSSQVARGKIRRAARRKEAIPADWALDEEGQPTTDAEAALMGSLLPIGGPKGYGLALAVDLIAGLITGSQYGPGIRSFHELKGATGVGVFTLAINIEKFIPFAHYDDLVEAYVAQIKSTPKAPGVARIYLPGEMEKEKEEASRSLGIEISEATLEKLNQLLARSGSAGRLSAR